MCRIFVGSIHNFGRSDDDIINVKMMIFTVTVYMCGLMPNLHTQILNGIYLQAGQVVQVVQDRKKARVRPCPRAQRAEPQ